MSLTAWTLIYLLELLFWLWIVRWGGAERLEGTFTSGLLVSIFAVNWSAEGIKLFAWLTLICSTVWFALGLFSPDLRFY